MRLSARRQRSGAEPSPVYLKHIDLGTVDDNDNVIVSVPEQAADRDRDGQHASESLSLTAPCVHCTTLSLSCTTLHCPHCLAGQIPGHSYCDKQRFSLEGLLALRSVHERERSDSVRRNYNSQDLVCYPQRDWMTLCVGRCAVRGPSGRMGR